MPTVKDLFYSAADGVFAIDGKQRVIYWDPGCEEMFGYSSQWVLGRPCCDVICGYDPISADPVCSKECSVSRLSKGTGSAPKSFQLRISNSDSEPLFVTVNIVLVPSECKKDWIVTHFLHREASPGVLKALEYAQANNTWMTQKVSGLVIESVGKAKSRLTAREQEVLLLLAEGLTSADVSERLSVSKTTIRNHIQHILSKLCVHSKTEAVAYAYRHALI